ncbi:MAG: acetyl/propionyl/methylcrotonyl-CoA carboxylase subunit alpha, partial [Candidatus Bipolaricaulia bacterium]
CRELGIETVAVYSEADRGALHTRFADESYLLGPPLPKESYLRGDRIIKLAKETGCEAIHPGYGFLAENAAFAQAVEESGLAFIGPTPEALRLMGDKVAARRLAREQGIPTIPGSGPVNSEGELMRSAKRIGYPLLLKAALGGGGKGMRIIHEEGELIDSFHRASSEAEAAFADPTIYLEKFIPGARHIEFQVLSDGRGNHVHLGERECSIQRRYQKLVEESPSPALTSELREEMGRAALKITRACGYRSAGTVEFLYDGEHFYFLEMNTRLQVEHPVTEEAFRVDIVKLQLAIAAGESLPPSLQGLQPRAHAIECRIYAEDPQNNFSPSTGVVEELVLPAGPGVRVDHGIYRGERITPYYYPLLAKLICWGEDRARAIARMEQALKEFEILGVRTTIGFHLKVMGDERFRRGEYDTGFLEGLDLTPQLSEEDLLALAAAAALGYHRERGGGAKMGKEMEDGWKAYLPWLVKR